MQGLLPPAILFPHCFIDRDRLRGAMGLFGALEICLPWEMDLKLDPVCEEVAPFVKLLRPPVALRPGTGFGRLLAEYRQWMRYHQDKSVFAFLSSFQGYDASEEKSWEIRKRLRGEHGQAEKPHEDQALKYHLVLHLAGETEESHYTAESLIDVLKASKSPLSGALDPEEKPLGLFDDLPSPKHQSLWQAYQWSQIVEAWFGLFHQHLKDRRILLTSDPGLADFLAEQLERNRSQDPDRLSLEMITVRLPQIPQTLSMEEISKTGRKLFPQETLGRLDGALRAQEDRGPEGAAGELNDPFLRALQGRVLVTLVN
jgi:hypothetical protein